MKETWILGPNIDRPRIVTADQTFQVPKSLLITLPDREPWLISPSFLRPAPYPTSSWQQCMSWRRARWGHSTRWVHGIYRTPPPPPPEAIPQIKTFAAATAAAPSAFDGQIAVCNLSSSSPLSPSAALRHRSLTGSRLIEPPPPRRRPNGSKSST